MKSTEELRQTLAGEIEALRNGASSAARLRAIAVACSTMLKAKQLDLAWKTAEKNGVDLNGRVEL